MTRAPSSAPYASRHVYAGIALGCLLLSLPAASGAAEGNRWERIAGDRSTRVEIDLDSLERISGGKVRVWHREKYSPRRLQEAWAFSYATMKQQTEFLCDKRTATPLRRIYLADNGSELKNETPETKDPQPVVPESFLEAVLSHACQPPPQARPAPVATPASPPVAATEQNGKPGKRKGKEEAAPPPPPPPKPPAAWAHEGRLGPERWAKLDPDYALCGSGQRQSPIDVRAPILADLPPIRFAYQAVPLQLLDDGHGILARLQGGGGISVDGEEYELQAMRISLPGEEMSNGKRAEMGLQFEHRSKNGQIAIVSVPVQSGKEHKLVRTLWNALPLERDKISAPAGMKFDPSELLPAKRDYITYSGSLTHPPCTEGVRWLIMKQPIAASKEQIGDFAKIYKGNVRPVQATNGRVVKESRPEPPAPPPAKAKR